MDFAIATFCYGDRYYGQVNRFIESFENSQIRPEIFIVTDNPNKIVRTPQTNIVPVSNFNEKYMTYSDSYYTFDFSVKRYSLLYAFNNRYNKVILTDADAVVNPSLFTEENIQKSFYRNTISGPVTYSFSEQIKTNSNLGRRFQYYEKVFDVNYPKDQLNEMPEDCVQYIYIDENIKYDFLKTWDECIDFKYGDNLPNVPAGNIDEMCFAALKNNIKVKNNSSSAVNLLINKHDKWYR